MKEPLIYGLLACQVFVVVFVALHDWVPLGKLNNIKAAKAVDPPGKLAVVTALSTLPFAIGLSASAYYASTRFPMWLFWWLWISYAGALYGLLRAWWVPYLLLKDPVRAARYQIRFKQTHAFLPTRNGIRPDTLHVCLHAVIILLVALLGVLTFSGQGFVTG